METGGKQYTIQEGEKLKIEKLPGAVGDAVEFLKVLFARGPKGFLTGTPYLENATVSGTIVSEGKHRKVLVFKKKRRKQYKRLRGHRQVFTEVQIDKIKVGAPKK